MGSPSSSARTRLPYKVGKVPFQAVAKALIGGEYEGFAKVIGNTETGDTLGVHVIGPHATDLISEATLAFSLDATPWEIGGATHAHPTLAEIIGEAAMAIDGRSINFDGEDQALQAGAASELAARSG